MYVCMCVCACVCSCMCACMHVCVCEHVYWCMCVSVHVCICVWLHSTCIHLKEPLKYKVDFFLQFSHHHSWHNLTITNHHSYWQNLTTAYLNTEKQPPKRSRSWTQEHQLLSPQAAKATAEWFCVWGRPPPTSMMQCNKPAPPPALQLHWLRCQLWTLPHWYLPTQVMKYILLSAAKCNTKYFTSHRPQSCLHARGNDFCLHLMSLP